jgi:hypothetical protein
MTSFLRSKRWTVFLLMGPYYVWQSKCLVKREYWCFLNPNDSELSLNTRVVLSLFYTCSHHTHTHTHHGSPRHHKQLCGFSCAIAGQKDVAANISYIAMAPWRLDLNAHQANVSAELVPHPKLEMKFIHLNCRPMHWIEQNRFAL